MATTRVHRDAVNPMNVIRQRFDLLIPRYKDFIPLQSEIYKPHQLQRENEINIWIVTYDQRLHDLGLAKARVEGRDQFARLVYDIDR